MYSSAFASDAKPPKDFRQPSDLEVFAARYAAVKRLCDKAPNPSERRTKLVAQVDEMGALLLEIAMRY